MTSEKQLIERARRFEEDALTEIYTRYSQGVYRYALHLLGDTRLAEDCTADTFLRFLQAIKFGGGPQDHLQAYLYRITHNHITDSYRRQPPPPLALLDTDASPDDGPNVLAEERIMQQRIRAALNDLTPDQRQVIALKYLEGWENEAVAVILQKSVGTIKSLQHRAIEALRRKLLPQMEERDGLQT
jgi:RNA polymerase sigma-70 factor (ECF subfamily)